MRTGNGTRSLVLVVLLSVGAARADPSVRPPGLPGSATAGAALDRCSEADHARGPARAELLKKGLALAEEAVATDDADARAHFAVFCNLGKQVHDAGLSVFNLGKLPRLRREVDRTLELAPASTDALVGKGAMLREMPRLLGGDLAQAERLLRRALDIDPAFPYAHVELARVLAARHAVEEARVEAGRALEMARERPGGTEAEQAAALLAELAR